MKIVQVEGVFIKEKNGQTRMIGFINDRIFRKRVKKSKHLFKKLDAWGIDAEIFSKKLLREVDEIRVLDEDENIVYSVGVREFDKEGKYLHFPPHQAQIFLPRNQWQQKNLNKNTN